MKELVDDYLPNGQLVNTIACILQELSSLHIASRFGFVEVVALLLKHPQIDVNLCDSVSLPCCRIVIV